MGLCFPEGRRNDLERGLRSALHDFGFEDPLSGIRWLISSTPTKSQIEVLAGHLTVGETYFFRDKTCFDLLEGRVLPEHVGLEAKRGQVPENMVGRLLQRGGTLFDRRSSQRNDG